MGYSIAWIAVETPDQSSLFQQLQLRRTNQTDEYFESPISGVALNGGWFLLAGNCAHRLIDPKILAAISSQWPCVACSVDDHVMFSSASFWSNGAEVWSATHDAQEGILHLATTGHVPASFPELHQRLLQQQEAEGGETADVDFIFDLPLLLARELTGFKHDEKLSNLAEPTPVAFIDEARKPLWKFW